MRWLRVAAALAVLLTVGLSPAKASAAGGWRIEKNPSLGTYGGYLGDVSCASSTFCAAVGGTDGPFSEIWNGRKWSARLVNVASEASSINAVSCSSPSFCMAVGVSEMDGPAAIVDEWDGDEWSPVPTPDLSGSRYYDLSGVSCLSADFCMATGRAGTGNLVESWDGSSWSVLPVPDKSDVGNRLYTVSCASEQFCVAVGGTLTSSDVAGSQYSEVWANGIWKIVAVPDPAKGRPDAQSTVYSVVCISETFCQALGSYSYTGSGGDESEYLGYDGRRWHVEPPPSSVVLANRVSCSSVTFCVAAGNTPGYEPALAQWNGTTWSPVHVPSPTAPDGAAFAGVSCTGSGDCQAVGSTDTGSGNQVLTERNY